MLEGGAGAPSQPMKRLSASSCVRSSPRKAAMGGGSGRAGISALLPMQLCFWRTHKEKSSSSWDSWDTMQRYEQTCRARIPVRVCSSSHNLPNNSIVSAVPVA